MVSLYSHVHQEQSVYSKEKISGFNTHLFFKTIVLLEYPDNLMRPGEAPFPSCYRMKKQPNSITIRLWLLRA